MSDWEGPGTTQVMPPASGGAPPAAPPVGPPAGPRPSHEPTGAPIWVLVALVVAAAAITGTAVYLLAGAQAPTLNAEIAVLQAKNAELEKQVGALTASVSSAQASASAAASAAAAASARATTGGSATTTTSKATVQFTYITKVTWSSSAGYRLTADYAQMLTGQAAADAATAQGDESPPPNGFYILNDNKKLRTFTLSKTAKITVLGWGGTDATTPKTIAVGQFMDVMPGGVNPQQPWKGAPYNITLSGSTVTKVEQVYIP